MPGENISQEFRLNNIDETRNYFIKEINQNDIYIEHLLISISAIPGCISISAFLIGSSIGITSSAVELKTV